jgi:hypothetical protein
MMTLDRIPSRAATAVVALACVLAPSFAQAGSTYQLAFDQSTYQVDPGGKVVVSVFLQEQVTGGSTSVLATDGLIGAGMRLSFDVAPLPSDPAKILSLGDVTLNDGPGAFSGGVQSLMLNPGSYVDLTETVDVNNPAVTATDLGGGLFQILIGSFGFTAGSIAGQVTTIQAGDIPGSFQDWITGAGDELDPLISAETARIEVRGAAVPEPSGLIGLTVGLIGAGGYGVARRRRSRAGS